MSRYAENTKVSSAQSQAEIERTFLRPEVQWFARQMEEKLRENDRKGGWKDMSLTWLHMRLIEEASEVEREIKAVWERDIDYDKIIAEAADVANFAMMIADVARLIKAPDESTVYGIDCRDGKCGV